MRFRHRTVFFAASALVAIMLAAAPSTRPKAPATRQANRSLQTLLDEGSAALAAGQYRAARDSFIDALNLDLRCGQAYHGLGVAYYQLGEYPKSGSAFDKAELILPGDRALLVNHSALLVRTGNPMRAAKMLRDQLAKESALDETLANALVVAVGHADEQARRNTFYPAIAVFLKTYDTKLEAALPGMKRWGVDWLPQSEFDQLTADAADAQKDIDDLKSTLASLDRQIADMTREAARLEQRKRNGWDMPSVLDDHMKKLSGARAERDTAQSELDKASDRQPKPAVPEVIVALIPSSSPKFGLLGIARKPHHADDDVAGGTVPADAPDMNPATRDVDGESPSTAPAPGVTEAPPATRGATPKSDPRASTTRPGIAAAPPPPSPPPPRPVRADAATRPAAETNVVQYAAAFAVAPDLLVTAAAPLDGATSVTIEAPDSTSSVAEVLRVDPVSGLALVRVRDRKLVPLPLADTAAAGALACCDFPEPNLFNPVPELLAGTGGAQVAEKAGWHIRLTRHPRLPGAPILAGGKVVGVVLAARDADIDQLPAATLAQLKSFLANDASAAGASQDPLQSTFQLTATRKAR